MNVPAAATPSWKVARQIIARQIALTRPAVSFAERRALALAVYNECLLRGESEEIACDTAYWASCGVNPKWLTAEEASDRLHALGVQRACCPRTLRYQTENLPADGRVRLYYCKTEFDRGDLSRLSSPVIAIAEYDSGYWIVMPAANCST